MLLNVVCCLLGHSGPQCPLRFAAYDAGLMLTFPDCSGGLETSTRADAEGAVPTNGRLSEGNGEMLSSGGASSSLTLPFALLITAWHLVDVIDPVLQVHIGTSYATRARGEPWACKSLTTIAPSASRFVCGLCCSGAGRPARVPRLPLEACHQGAAAHGSGRGCHCSSCWPAKLVHGTGIERRPRAGETQRD